jgi:spermidine/putrescine transport system permease protein
MTYSADVPSWAYILMLVGLAVFVILIAVSVRQHKGVKRSLFSMPYALWMVVFTVLPCVLIAYYAFTDSVGHLTLDNVRHFWDANHTKNQLYTEMGGEMLSLMRRGTVNADTLVYSLWMAFACTAVCLLFGYPAALFMADRHMKIGSTVVILFIIPMWMNFLLRTIALMSLLEDQGFINTLLRSLGHDGVELMYNNGAVLLGMIYNFLPFMVFPIYTSLSKLDPKLSEAAQDLGASEVRTFIRVTLPLSVPGIISGITMVFMPSVTTFFISRLLGGGKTLMFGDLIESMFLTENNWGVGSALSLIMMLLILVSLGILRKADPEGEGSGIA